MGYSIACRPRSPELKAKVLAFFAKHYRPFSEIAGRDSGYSTEPMDGKNLGYGRHAGYVVIDYKPSVGDDEYAHALMRWIAIRVGVQKHGVPVVRYDWSESWEVPPKWYDRDGWFTQGYYEENPKSTELFTLRTGPGLMEMIHLELQRLSKLWDEEEKA